MQCQTRSGKHFGVLSEKGEDGLHKPEFLYGLIVDSVGVRLSSHFALSAVGVIASLALLAVYVPTGDKFHAVDRQLPTVAAV